MDAAHLDRVLRDLTQRLLVASHAGAALALVTLSNNCGGNSSSSAHGGQSTTLGGAFTSGQGGTTAQGGSIPVQGGSSSAQGGSAVGVSGGDDAGGHGGEPVQPQTPFPLTQVGCFGETQTGGYEGQCCVQAQCFEASSCPAADAAAVWRSLPNYPPGSGSCGCETPGHPALEGPYAPNPEGKALGSGSCCYLVGAIRCEGRPLIVDGALLLAAVVTRDDWGVAFV